MLGAVGITRLSTHGIEPVTFRSRCTLYIYIDHTFFLLHRRWTSDLFRQTADYQSKFNTVYVLMFVALSIDSLLSLCLRCADLAVCVIVCVRICYGSFYRFLSSTSLNILLTKAW